VVAYAQRLDVRDQSEPEPGRGRAPEPRDDGADWDVAYADRERKLQPEGPIQDERRRTGNGRGEVADPVREGQSIFSGGEARSELAGRRAPSGGGWWDLEPDVDRVANGISRRVDRLRGLGNAVVPQVAEFVGRRMLSELFNGGLP
jgi:DNA (cytosine-5)-methyltransferase 1